MSMKNKFILTILFAIIMSPFFPIPPNADETNTRQIPTVDFSKDIKRLSILQDKFIEAKTPVERYKYASIMCDYLKNMTLRIESVKDLYYKPAVFIMTDELPDTIEIKDWEVSTNGTID